MLRSSLSRRFWVRHLPVNLGAKFSQGGKDVLIREAITSKVRGNQRRKKFHTPEDFVD